MIARPRAPVHVRGVKRIEVSDEAHASLQRLADAKQLTVAELIASLVDTRRPALAGDTLLFHLASPEFAALPGATERYLDLLAWCARNYATDFADFISHQESGRRYLAWSRDEINAARLHNQARQIDGTQFWAVMTIDDATRRRFVCRLLEFIGCHDETVAEACRALGLHAPGGLQRSA
jgi:negative regulator of replication initiation